jgi:hypothetical protein
MSELESTVSAVPNTPSQLINITTPQIKPATPDLIVFNDGAIPVEYMTDLTFEQIGGQEILGVSRGDLVNGQDVVYTPIQNLSTIEAKYNSKNLLPLSDTSKTIFDNYPIKLENYIPEEGTGSQGEIVYIDEAAEELVVSVIGMQNNDQVEIQVLYKGDSAILGGDEIHDYE